MPYALANRLVTRGEWAAFTADGGYRDTRWWASAGWDWVRAQGIGAPLHDRPQGRAFTLHGELDLPPSSPVCHVSWFEADAFARWFAAQPPNDARWQFTGLRLARDAA